MGSKSLVYYRLVEVVWRQHGLRDGVDFQIRQLKLFLSKLTPHNISPSAADLVGYFSSHYFLLDQKVEQKIKVSMRFFKHS